VTHMREVPSAKELYQTILSRSSIPLAGFEGGNMRDYKIKTKIISSRDLTSECWSIQAWGLPHCRECEYLATIDCGGVRIRKEILSGNYPKTGLPGKEEF